MGVNLYWSLPATLNVLPRELLRALQSDDSPFYPTEREGVIDAEALQFLYGLRAAGVPGATELIGLIQHHGSVILRVS